METPDSFGALLEAALGGNGDPATPETNPPQTPEPPKAPAETPAAGETPGAADPSADPLLTSLLGKEEKKEGAADEGKKEGEAKTPEGEGDDLDKKYPDPKDITPKAGEAFRNLKTELKTQTATIKELQSKLAELQKAPAQPATPQPDPEIERIKAEHAEMVRELRIARVEATPEFKRAVIQPLATLEKNVETLAAKYDVPKAELIAALQEPDPAKRSDLFVRVGAGFNEFDRLAAFRISEQYADIADRHQKITGDTEIALERINAQRAEEERQHLAKFQEEFQQVTRNTWDAVKKDVPVLRKIEGQDSWNRMVDQVERAALTTDFDKLDLATKARALHQGLALPAVYSLLRSANQELETLRKQNAQLRGASPAAGAGSTPGSAPAHAAPEGASFLDAIEANFREYWKITPALDPDKSKAGELFCEDLIISTCLLITFPLVSNHHDRFLCLKSPSILNS